jgi:hypothetical protein
VSVSWLAEARGAGVRRLMRAMVVAVVATAGPVSLPSPGAAAPSPACAAVARSEADAVTVAKRCHRAVEVSSLASETVKVTAGPDGRLAWEQHAAPVRVRRGGGWVPVDTGLVVRDGRPGPKASAVEVRFSRGGTDPVATIAAAGGSVSMSWPGSLPAPVTNGDTATYPGVLPGVDLRLRATATGFTQVLVVHDAAAAANPRLRAIRYGLSSNGLTVGSRRGGGFDVKDASGRVVLSGAPGSMWDSSSPAGAAAGASARGAESRSTAETPGDRARIAPVRLAVGGGSLTVMPDAGLLTDPRTVFPLFIDPPVNTNKNRWGYANDEGNNRADGVARAGLNPDGSGVYRSYFEFDVSPLRGKNVYGARFYINLMHTSPCAATPVSLWNTGAMDAGVNGTRTTWAPAMNGWLDGKTVGLCGYPPSVPIEFGHNLYYHARWAANNGGTITLGLATLDESGYGEGVDYWKKFDPATAKLTVWYNTPPNVPAFLAHNATTDCYKACTSATAVSASTTQAQGWWRLNETSGTVAADAATPAHPATAAGGVAWADGGASFSGGGDLYTSGPVLDTTKSFTVSAWARLTDNSTWRSVLNQDANAAAGFTLQYDKGADRWSFIMFDADANGTSGVWANSSATATLNAWTHLVGVYDTHQDGKTRRMRLYVNGTLDAEVPAATGIASNGAFTIGRSRHDSTNKNYFHGGVDNVQAYQRAVTGADVAALYAAGRAGGALHISPAVVRTTTPTLSARVSDPDPNAQLWSEFEVRTAPSETATLLHLTGGMGPHSSGTALTTPVPAGKFTAGNTYYWRAYSVDEVPWNGGWSPFHAVRVDTTPPALGTPPVASAQYPQQQWGAKVGDQGTFALSSGSADAVALEWWVDNGAHTTTPVVGAVTVPVTWTPATDMVHTMQVKVVDKAGNISGTASYQFWVTPSPNVYTHWKLDEASGNTAADSGNAPSYAGVLSPATLSTSGVAFGPGWVKDANGQPTNGLVFTGNGSAAATRPVLDTTKPFTAMAWVKPSDLTADRTILSQDGTASSRFQLHFDRQANGGGGGWCASMRGTDDGTPVSACTNGAAVGPPSTTAWVHVAVVYQPALSSQQLRVYVMGDPRSCFEVPAETAATTFTGAWSATGSLVLGRAKAGGTATEHWRGGIDDVWAFQRALTGAEICQKAQP